MAVAEVDKLDDVGRALERVRKHKVPLSATLGRHMNDQEGTHGCQLLVSLEIRVDGHQVADLLACEGKQHPIIHEGAEPDPVDSNEEADDKTEVLEPDGEESPHA